ncbi:MAG TPA: CbiX/SirB N-terminal domain-containing protein [Burkholderiaceae bacterium]|nr:CbiX/SirB N-terminal domain-containing protein [Burkholderiaceae bacterium]
MKQGLLLLAHGARDPRWAQPFESVAGRIRAERPELELELAFLEFMAPDLLAAGQRLAEAGCEAVAVPPLFLGMGGHVRNQVPALVEQLAAAHGAIRWSLQPTIGEAEAVIEAIAAEALRRLP